MILGLVEEAQDSGARLSAACRAMGLDARTVQRWRQNPGGGDDRRGPKTVPGNKFTEQERGEILEVLTAAEFTGLSPNQVVPQLADQGMYLGSEATMYRVLRAAQLLGHRERSRPRRHRRPPEHVATGPNQVWSWDITYLKSPIRGVFFYLYLMVDVWSRKIVGAAVHEMEAAEAAASLLEGSYTREGVARCGQPLVLHSDNGSPMKGATMVAKIKELGVLPSLSRPHTSDDNAFSEALFRTLKYRPSYPDGAFASLEDARRWVEAFVRWYNGEALHSGIRFVTPEDRHEGRAEEILARRHRVYETARSRRPDRWSGRTRNWTPVDVVRLNPPRAAHHESAEAA
jgi:putative transposase